MSHKQLIDAIKNGKATEVSEILYANPTFVNAVDDHGFTALQTAVTYGFNQRTRRTQPIVEAILEHITELSLGDAAMLGDLRQLQAAIKTGKDVQETDRRGWTALHWAAEIGNEHCARILLDAGADPNTPSGDGPPLERAAHAGPNKPAASQEVIELLIERGASIAVHHAAMIGDAKRLAAIIQADPSCIHQRDTGGATPLYHAAHNLHLSCIDLLLAQGAAVDTANSHGQTPVSTAVDHMWDEGGPQVVARLLEENPRLDFFTAAQVNDVPTVRSELAGDPTLVFAEKWGYTALYLAAGANADGVIKVLVAGGADADWQRPHDGLGALHNAAWHGQPAAVQTLLRAGSNPNLKCNKGNTPLHLAIRRHDAAITRLLVDAGADPSVKNRDDETPLDLAHHLNDPTILVLVESQ